MKIIERIPKTQTQELIRFEDGSEVIRCYSPSNPHYYKNHKDELLPIDLSFEKESTSKVGNIRIREKNVNSVGYREDNNPYKYVGIRPDRNQEFGTEQLEFTLKEIVVNDEDIPIDLSKNDVLEEYPNIVNLGNVLIHAARQFTRQIVNPDRKIETFKITYLIHTTGLDITNDKDETDYFIADESGEFSFSSSNGDTEYVINLPLLLDENFEQVHFYEDDENPVPDYYENLTRHSLRDLGHGTLEYIKYSSGEQIPESAKYIDVSACGGNTPCAEADGYMYVNTSKKTTIAETWSTAKSYSGSANKAYHKGFAFVGNQKSGSKYKITRSFFKFDTSGISNASLVTFNYYVLTNWVLPRVGQQVYTTIEGELSDGTFSRAVMAKSTWAPLSNGKLSTSDWSSVAISQYGTATAYSDTDGTGANSGQYNVVTVNSTGTSDINSSSEFKFALVTYHDYADAAPPSGLDNFIYNISRIAQVDYSGISRDPYLDITSGYSGTVMGVTSGNIAKIIGMTNQQVKNVMGA